MKTKVIFLFFTIFLCFSCSDANDGALLTNTIYGKWQLEKMTGSFVGSETTGDEMDWQEFYIFNENNTFSRSRIRDGETTDENGTFSIKVFDDGRAYFCLIYPNGSKLVGNCTGTNQEELIFSEKNILSSTWQACDGPGLDYKKVSN